MLKKRFSTLFQKAFFRRRSSPAASPSGAQRSTSGQGLPAFTYYSVEFLLNPKIYYLLWARRRRAQLQKKLKSLFFFSEYSFEKVRTQPNNKLSQNN